VSKTLLSTMALYRVFQVMGEGMDRDAPLLNLLALARIAAAGEPGIDQGTLKDELKVANATIIRVVDRLSDRDKDGRAGYGLIERVMNPSDMRLRLLKLTPKGARVMEKAAEQMRKA
jgi:DNA-binding MarR family transcriptional regulator